MHKTVVINAVGVTPSLITDSTPHLRALARNGVTAIRHVAPAVTCSVQSTYLTGTLPDRHGIVGNGWYDRTDCEVKFWKQSNRLVSGEKVWDAARRRDHAFTCANLFWWFNMYSSVDVSVTPRPMYLADGRKLPDVYTHPSSLRHQLQSAHGQFPLFDFWGPRAGIRSTQWIVDASLDVLRNLDPTLTLIYLPHLDYDLQRFGPGSASAQRATVELDREVGRLLDHPATRGRRVVVLSEYGIEPVDKPVHINRALAAAGHLTTRDEQSRQVLDPGGSAAFAVADHQVAHVYLNDESKRVEVRQLLEGLEGVGGIYEGAARAEIHLDHPRAGDFVVIAAPGCWFTYYYWLDDSLAPDFARTVDIHRKPGYDPAELFVDPALSMPRIRIAWKLFRKALGFRYLMDVIPLDASLVRGSHGREPSSTSTGPLLMSSVPTLVQQASIEPTDVCRVILDHVFSG